MLINDGNIFWWVQVDSANKHGVLLEMVQVLTDLDLLISKSYISSDGGWLMDGEPNINIFIFLYFSTISYNSPTQIWCFSYSF